MTPDSPDPAGRSDGYGTVTETPGLQVTPENLRMLHTRYRWAAEEAEGDVLEVAAGAALGWAHLEAVADRLVATDLDPWLVRRARSTLGAGSDLAVAEASRLPFADGVFDTVVLFEAVYYLPDIAEALEEIRRVAASGGSLLLSTANPERPGFVRSPASRTYPDAEGLADLLDAAGFRDVEIGGAHRVDDLGWKDAMVLRGIEIADRLHLIPRSLEGRARFKRILHGELVTVPDQVEPGAGHADEPQPIDPQDAGSWKVLYARGRAP